MKIPVLMYHALILNPNTKSHKVHVLVSEFEKQMNWLKEEGYSTLSLSNLTKTDTIHNKNEKKVLITFDDGFFSLYKYAMPILGKHHFNAVLFLTTAPVGKNNFEGAPGLAISQPPGDRPLSWNEIREMENAGWEIAAHSQSHPNHASLSKKQLEYEILGSIRIISTETKQAFETTSYAFPYGYYSELSLQVLKENNIRSSFSVHPGLAKPGKDLLRIPRISIERTTNLANFRSKVKSGYASTSQKIKSYIRDFLFSSSRFKDLISSDKKKVPA